MFYRSGGYGGGYHHSSFFSGFLLLLLVCAIAGCIQPGHVTEIIPAKLRPSRCGC